MSSEESEQRNTGILGGLLAPLRLPERVIQALESLAHAAQEVAPMRAELTRVREQTEPLANLIPALERLISNTKPVPELGSVVEQIRKQTEPLTVLIPELERIVGGLGTRIDSLRDVVLELQSEEANLNKTVCNLVDELGEMHESIKELRGDVKSVTEHLPNSRGPLQKARDVLTAGDDD